MLYNIAGMIIFNPEDGSLIREEDGEAVQLTLPASRLLHVLLTAPHGLMEREVLLTEVWDKYGLRGSHNNLNQYVSILRRTLASLGCDNLIVTVPKMGFRLNPEVTIVPFEPVIQAETLPATEPISAPVKQSTATSSAAPQASNSYIPSTLSLLLLALILVLLIGYTMQKRTEWSVREIHPISGGMIGKCQLFFLQSINSTDRERFKQQAISILKENGLPCASTRVVYLDNYISKSAVTLGRTLLSSCRLSDDNRVVDCKNFYYQDRDK
ncbi:transcriptional regulator [Enterobacteriaceae bacterium C23F]